MNVMAFINSPEEEDLSLAERILAFYLESYHLYPHPQYPLRSLVPDADVVVTFGKFLGTMAGNVIREKDLRVLLICLPSIKKLQDKPENKPHRLETRGLLENLKRLCQAAPVTATRFDRDNLPDLSSREVLLQEALASSGPVIRVAKDGQTVEIRSEETAPSRAADISITYSELFAIRTAMEILGVDQVEVKREDR
jgi:hypothetical protein